MASSELPVNSLAAHLLTLSPDQVAELLTRRLDATFPPVPKDMTQLAERLVEPSSLAAAVVLLNRPQLQVAEAIAAIGDGCTPASLGALLGVPENDPDLRTALHGLADLAFVWPRAKGFTGSHLDTIWPHPLGLGASARELLDERNLPMLRRLAAQLRVTAGRSKADVVSTVAEWMADGDNIRRLVEDAPAGTRATLHRLAWEPPVLFGSFGIMFGAPPAALQWAADHGLVLHAGWNGGPRMPREVALALRGPDYRAPFDPNSPSLATTPTAPEAVRREAAAAAAATVSGLTAVIEAAGGTPITPLKTGGIGVRELRRLAKASGQAEHRVRLMVELAAAGGLIGVSDAGVAPSDGYDDFTTAEPADQLLDLVTTWLDLPSSPLAATPPGEPTPPALAWDEREEAVLVPLRASMLRTVAAILTGSRAADADAMADQLRWHRPALADAVGDDLGRLVDGMWHEAHQVGLLAHGAPTELCTVILAGDTEATMTQARAMMPQQCTSVVLQADLTAVVTGVPSSDLLTLLDAAADPESRSGAWTWRFSPASVRRSLDAGAEPQELLARLTEAAEGGRVPQPLSYLITDVARQHGRVQVRPAGCCLCGDDPVLLTEILSAKALARLKLTRLAPTVLASAVPPAETLAALRAAGYAPSGVHADGTRALDLTPRHRAKAVPDDNLEPEPMWWGSAEQPTDPATLARNLTERRRTTSS